MIVRFALNISGLSPPEFIITMKDTTSITVQITGFSGSNREYQLNISLQASGEHIRTLNANELTMTTTIDNLHPFTMYKIELRVRIRSSDPWSYPATREVKTLEEGIDDHDIATKA
jgi:hypothetical protein